jgi:CBS domain-containing protein
MSHFKTPVAVYAHGPIVSVHVDTPVPAVLSLMEERNVSAVPVLDERKRAVGVISRTDLLRIGTPRPVDASPRRSKLVDLPRQPARQVMHEGVVSVPRETSVAEAAKRMVDERMHRVFVTHDEGSVAEVFGTREVMLAIWEARVTTPIGQVMSRKPFVIPYDATVSVATARLEQAHTQGLVVVDAEAWPIGLFTQREALEARSFQAARTVEDAMSHGMLCLHKSTPLFRAAAQAAHTRSRRVLVVEDSKVVGVLTGLDFARLAR